MSSGVELSANINSRNFHLNTAMGGDQIEGLSKMPPRKNPCVACKEKHLKCSDDTPKCKRCETRNIECVRPTRRKAFKHGSSANYASKFSSSQNWVKSSAREFRLQTEAKGPVQRIAPEQKEATPAVSPELPKSPHPESTVNAGGGASWSPIQVQPTTSPYGNGSVNTSSSLSVLVSPPARNDTYHHRHDSQNQHTGNDLLGSTTPALSQQHQYWDGSQPTPSTISSEHDSITIQEACLLKHFIDKLSHWFDTCDPRRSFELLVPERARKYPPLLHAIYAVSARHLCRKFATSRGVVFQGQLLSTLTPSTAVEYMLRCIPVLREFHRVPDEETRELIITMAVILRQFEEIDVNVDENDLGGRGGAGGRVNFLSVINAVLRTSRFESFFKDSELLKASYWVALRQEVYYALRKGHAPEMSASPQQWDVVSPANRLIVHTSRVAGWLFNGKSVEDYVSLKEQESILSREVGSRLEPILSIPANKETGEVFPRVWFRSSIALTSMQHFMISKMILTAESPLIAQETDMRTAFRVIEGEVRSTILDICGSALGHLQTPPALINAVLAISLYGHFFVDEYERNALKGIVKRFQDAQAWPVPKGLEGFV